MIKKIMFNGYLLGLLVSILTILVLSSSYLHHFRVAGEMNIGHENLVCNECHEIAEGSLRQQIQANISYLLGQRQSLASFNFKLPNSKDCLACHYRENDKHPIYRFNEPRFSEARKSIKAQFCVSCHKEHTGLRVTSKVDNCQHCHQDLTIKNDPIDISHQDLIKLKNWSSCLSCHDFHGNHIMQTPTKVKNRLEQYKIHQYMQGEKDPYSDKKYNTNKRTRYED